MGWIWSRGGLNDSQPQSIHIPAATAGGERTSPNSRSIDQPAAERVNRLKHLIKTSNVPITFWGKLIDEAGVGLTDVRITYRIQKASLLGAGGIGPTNGAPVVLSTDGNGLFSVTNAHGVILNFESFEKDGYELMGNQRIAFAYSRTPEIHSPIRDAPQVFVMRSSNANDTITNRRSKYRLSWDGKPIHVALDSGNPPSTGNLTITAYRSAAPGQVRNFEWQFSLQIQGGELQQEAEKQTALIAPVEGYHLNWSCGSTADEKPWKGGYSGNIFFKTNSKYGRINIDVHPDARPDETAFHLETFINNSGGRNTEGR